MGVKRLVRRSFGYVGQACAIGATVTAGFLSFAGMFVIAPVVFWCTSAFVLAAAYEGQVNSEGISMALRRMFGESYLKRGIIRRHLEERIGNERLNAYNQLKNHNEKLELEKAHLQKLCNELAKENTIQHFQDKKKLQLLQAKLKLANENYKKAEAEFSAVKQEIETEINKNKFLKDYFYQSEHVKMLEKIHEPDPEIKAQIKNEKKTLKRMELFFLRQLEENNPTAGSEMELAACDLFTPAERAILLKEIFRKKWIIRGSWLFALGGGVSQGLAGLSAVKSAVASIILSLKAVSVGSGIVSSLAGSSAFLLALVPGGVFVVLVAFAAAGYTLLLFQGMSDMVQNYIGKLDGYFERNRHDSNRMHYAKCVLKGIGLSLAAVLGVFCAATTVVTWWGSAQEGALQLGMGERAANITRSIAVSLMGLSVCLFYSSTSVESIHRISKSSYGDLLQLYGSKIKDAWCVENLVQFFNPFRFAKLLIQYTADSVLFLGHLISMGAMTDRFGPVPAGACAVANAISEGLTDSAYLPHEEEGHGHASWMLKVLFFPIKVVTWFLSLLAVVWDRPFSGSFQKAYNNIFEVEDYVHPTLAEVKPSDQISTAWRKQEVTETLGEISNRLKIDTSKGRAARDLKAHIQSEEKEISEETIATAMSTFEVHRTQSTLWQAPGLPRSAKEFSSVCTTYRASLRRG